MLTSVETGGRDTAGMGGRGGYKRLYKGGDIKQVGFVLLVPLSASLPAHEVLRFRTS